MVRARVALAALILLIGTWSVTTSQSIYRVALPQVAAGSVPNSFVDNFDNPLSGWPSSDDGNIRRGYLTDSYQILVRQPGWLAIASPGVTQTNVSVSVEADFASSDQNLYGIAVNGSSDWSSFVAFLVDPSFPIFYLWQVTNNNWVQIAQIEGGEIIGQSVNTLQMQCQDNQITASAGMPPQSGVGTYRVPSCGGQVGLIAGTYNNTSNADARFQQFAANPIVSPTPTPISAWTRLASMPTGRVYLGAAADTNGKIYAIGGLDDSGHPSSVNEEYDPATNTWAERAPMPWSGAGSVVALPNGMLLAFGGGISNNGVAEYDPSADTWTTRTSSPLQNGISGQAVLANNGEIYVGGGTIGGFGEPTGQYDPSTDTWTTVASQLGGFLTVGASIGGEVYYIVPRGLNDQLEQYDPPTNTWTTLPSLPSPLTELSLVAASNGDLYAIGGMTDVNGLSVWEPSVYQYDPIWQIWSTPSSLWGASFGQNIATAATSSGQIYAIGGYPYDNQVYETTIVGKNLPLVAQNVRTRSLQQKFVRPGPASKSKTGSSTSHSIRG